MTEAKNEEMFVESKWYHKIRYWLLFLAVFSVAYFIVMQIPSRPLITPETTGIANPVATAEGRPDYMAAIDDLFAGPLNQPESNGFRQLLAACGPQLILPGLYYPDDLEQLEETGHNNWDVFRLDPFSQFEDTWKPLCLKLGIDPDPEPEFYKSYGLNEMVRREAMRTNDGDPDQERERERELSVFYRLSAWNPEEHPEAVKWLESRSPLLDLFKECIEYEYFCCPAIPFESPDNGILWRGGTFSADFQVRIAYNIARDDFDAAWSDIAAMLRYSRTRQFRHSYGELFEESATWDSLRLLLDTLRVDVERLKFIANEIDSIPPSRFTKNEYLYQKYWVYCLVNTLPARRDQSYFAFIYEKELAPAEQIAIEMPIDVNIIGQTATRIIKETGLDEIEVFLFDKSETEEQKAALKKAADYFAAYEAIGNSEEIKYRQILTVGSRGSVLGKSLFTFHYSNIEIFFRILRENQISTTLARTAVAIEMYERANGKYPAQLAELCPEHLTQVPLDVFSKNDDAIFYKLSPDEETAYLLYSVGPDGDDNGGGGDDLAWKCGR